MDIVKAIQKPFSDPKTLVIGAILSVIPVVQLITTGFSLKVAEDTMKGKHALRAWSGEDLVDYIVKFIMAFIIGFVYMIVPLIIMGVGAGAALVAAIGAAASNPANMGFAVISSLAIGGPFILIGAILMVVAMVMLPMAILRYLKKGNLGDAFAVGTVLKNVLTADYIVGLIVSIIYAAVVLVVAVIVGAILAMVPMIGWVISLLVLGAASFIMEITIWSILAQTVK